MPTGTYRASAFLAAARRLDLEVVVASEEPSTLGATHPGSELVVDFQRPEQAPEGLPGVTRVGAIAAVVPVDETAVMVASHLALALGVPGNHPSAALATRDKSILRAQLQAGGVPQPEWVLWEGEDPPPWDIFPAVLKPLDQAASRGVVRVDGWAQLAAEGRRIRHLLAHDPRCAPGPGEGIAPLLIEGFVPGPEVAVEALTRNGRLVPLAIYDKPEPLDGPYFEETIYTVPTALPGDAQRALLTSLEAAAEAVGLGTGTVHAELRLGQGLPRVIDMASRSIGGRCSAVLRFESGHTLEELILANALGDPLPNLDLEEGGFGVMMLPVPRAGRLLAVEGREASLAVAGVESLQVAVPIGGRVEPPPGGDRYLGFLFAHGADGAQAAAALSEAHSRLRFDIEEEDQDGG